MKLLKGLNSGYVGQEVTFNIIVVPVVTLFSILCIIIIHPIEKSVATTKSMPSYLRVISSNIESRLLSHISRNRLD